jgi:acetyl-CoA carboxylase biotin carboxyl carrier protein
MDQVSKDDIQWLLALLEEERLAEVAVREGDLGVTVKAVTSYPINPTSTRPASAATSSQNAPPAVPDNLERLVAPMAGIFYRTPSPEGEPFVEVGDEVQVGDTIGLIEAMKLYNEVTTHLHGRIVQFLVENEGHVEADQPLALIERLSH